MNQLILQTGTDINFWANIGLKLNLPQNFKLKRLVRFDPSFWPKRKALEILNQRHLWFSNSIQILILKKLKNIKISIFLCRLRKSLIEIPRLIKGRLPQRILKKWVFRNLLSWWNMFKRRKRYYLISYRQQKET